MLARSVHPLLVSLCSLALPACSGGGGSGGGTDGGTDGSSSDTQTTGSASASASASGTDSASGGSSGTGGSSDSSTAGTSGTTGAACEDMCPGGSTLAVSRLDTTAISDMGVPFDTDAEDTVSPYAWGTNYGKQPEIIPIPGGDALDILWRDHTEGGEPTAYMVHVEPDGDGYAVTRAYEVQLLSNLMGFTRDADGSYYYATGVDEGEDITVDDPAPGLHRPDIVRVVKFDECGCVQMESDVDLEREKTEADSEAIINPMVAASSRMAWGGGSLSLVHGINTEPDGNDVRHQKALTTHIDPGTGAVTRVSSMWVSHSFDQRLLWDGTGFVELHLGDAYPRALAFARFTPDDGTKTYELFDPKGDLGDNSTFTRLGGVAQVDGDFGYVVAFTTDRSPNLPTGQWATIEGNRDLAIIRVRSNFAAIDPDQGGFIDESGDTQMVTSSGDPKTNHLTWLTDYGTGGDASIHAARSRIVNVGGDQLVVLWERWAGAGDEAQHTGTQALVLDAGGAVQQPETKVSDHHISRGDDAVALGGRAVFVTGQGGALHLNLVGPDLATQAVDLP